MATFCFCPPESVAISRPRRSAMPTASSAAVTRSSIWSWGTPKFSSPNGVHLVLNDRGDHLRIDVLQDGAHHARDVTVRVTSQVSSPATRVSP